MFCNFFERKFENSRRNFLRMNKDFAQKKFLLACVANRLEVVTHETLKKMLTGRSNENKNRNKAA